MAGIETADTVCGVGESRRASGNWFVWFGLQLLESRDRQLGFMPDKKSSHEDGLLLRIV